MKHRKGIDLVREGIQPGYTVGEGSGRGVREPTDQTFRIEVWDEPPESGGSLIETISRSTDFSVSCASLKAAVRARPGKVLIHLNGRYRMSCDRAPDPPLPERQRPPERAGRPQHSDHTMQTR